MRTHINNTARFIPVSVVREDTCTVATLDAPLGALDYWREIIAGQPDHEPDKESLSIVLLNARLRPYAWHRISVGTNNETIAHPRDILRPAIVGNAHGFLLYHNHPSGDPSPSRADRELTRRIAEAATLMQVNFIDHMVTTDTDRTAPNCEPYFSFQESGLL